MQSKTISNENASVEQKNNAQTSFAVEISQANSLVELIEGGALERMSSMKRSAVNLASSYLDVEMNKPQCFMFLGITERVTQETGEVLPCIVLLDKDAGIKENMAVLLVSTFVEKQIPLNSFVEITWTGLKKNKESKGSSRTWDVRLLTENTAA